VLCCFLGPGSAQQRCTLQRVRDTRDSRGSYTMAWGIGVTLGLAGGLIQVAFALIRPSQPPVLRTA
jgi:hypothetical protein